MTFAKILLIALAIVLFVIFTLPVYIMGVWNTGNYIGIIASAMCVVYCIFFEIINGFICSLAKQALGKALLIFVSALILAALAFVAVVTVNMALRANVAPPSDSTVVVLGCRVRESGASTMLKTRLDAAYEFLTENPDVNCILSGGQGKDEPISEALYMYEWLVEKGIDENRLFMEDKSTSTEENLKLSKKLIEEKGLSQNVTLITNEFHQFRAYRFAKESGFDNCYSYSAKTPWYVLPTYYVREICGVAHMIFIK